MNDYYKPNLRRIIIGIIVSMIIFPIIWFYSYGQVYQINLILIFFIVMINIQIFIFILSRIQSKFKNTYKLIFGIILILIIWLFLRPKTPQEQAIAEYIKGNSNSCTFTMMVKDSDKYDPQYGELYDVHGVIGNFADINFFYLIKDSGGWKVNSAGTGP